MNDRLLDLYGGDPFHAVLQASERHRPSHGPMCGLFPTGPHVMRLVATLVKASGARRILDLGTGFGYSALWIADAAGPDAHVLAIDRFREHVAEARTFTEVAGLSSRIEYRDGEVAEVLRELVGPHDLIHDDAWFAEEPSYFERMTELLKPGGVLTMPNWFLLEDAITERPRRDWAELAGEQWKEHTLRYARRLADEARFHVTWTVSPPLGVAIRI